MNRKCYKIVIHKLFCFKDQNDLKKLNKVFKFKNCVRFISMLVTKLYLTYYENLIDFKVLLVLGADSTNIKQCCSCCISVRYLIGFDRFLLIEHCSNTSWNISKSFSRPGYFLENTDDVCFFLGGGSKFLIW